MTPSAYSGARMIFLARHGRTSYNHEGRFQGQGAVPLDEHGRMQAAELAELAAEQDFAALWASPLARARETAEIVSARIGLPVREDARLVETDAGDWTDRLFADVHAQDPAAFQAFASGDPSFAFPGGESFAAQGDRVMEAVAEIEQGPLPALVVCHGMTIRLALARSLGEPGPGPRLIDNGMLIRLEGSER